MAELAEAPGCTAAQETLENASEVAQQSRWSSGCGNTVHIRFMGAQVSHADIDIHLRPSKRRAENVGVQSAHKRRRTQTEDIDENVAPKVVENDDEKCRNANQSGYRITEVSFRVN